MSSTSDRHQSIYQSLFKSLGPQHWWPGETQFEIIVGAILTQNTAWSNVEKAINNLKSNQCLNPEAIKKVRRDRLAQLIRPSGYFNQKAKKLKNFISFLCKSYGGSLRKMAMQSTGRLREELLEVNGIGPETADSILLYAFDRPVFVIDAYTKRIFSRHRFCKSDIDYHNLQHLFQRNLPSSSQLFNEFHALIVITGKNYCKKSHPDCTYCPLRNDPHVSLPR